MVNWSNKNFLISGAAAISLMASTPAWAQHRRFDVPAQPATKAIPEFASQAGIQIIAAGSRLRGKRTTAIKGDMDARAALRQMLKGTNLRIASDDGSTITLAQLDVQAAASFAGQPQTATPSSGASTATVEPASPGTGEAGTASSSGDAPGAAGSNEQATAEIVVTAQRREERLQQVPISISVLAGSRLDSSVAQGTTDALNSVPGVATTATNQNGGTLVSIRGVSAGDANFNGSSPVGFYVDSMPFGFVKSAFAPDLGAYDLDRVEVLRGPQGTLYGASAQNGVVRVLTHAADLNEFELKSRALISETKGGGANYRGDLAVNIPLVPDVVAARFVAGYQDLSGWIDRPNDQDANTAKIKNFRGRIDAEPVPGLTLGVSTWLSRGHYGAPDYAADNGKNSSIADESTRTRFDLYGFHLEYEASAFTLSIAPSLLKYKSDGFLDYEPFIPDTVLQTIFRSKTFSNEINLRSNDPGPWRWSVGGIYRHGEDRLFQLRRQYIVPTDYSDVSESFAVFGELTRTFLNDQFEITGGLRYFHDDVTNQEHAPFDGNPATPLIRSSNKFEKVSPRLVATWHPSSDLSLYASYGSGFRSGFPQNPNVLRTAPQFPPLKADNLINYEVGTKGRALGGDLRYEIAVYYIDWQNVQQTLTVPFQGGAVSALVNGESASGMGVDALITTSPFKGLQLSANFNWNDLTFDAPIISSGIVLFDKGDRLNLSPEYTAGASAQYSFPISNSLEGRLALSGNYTSKQEARTEFGIPLAGIGDNIFLAKASFALTQVDRWTATVFVDNLTDERGALQRSSLIDFAPNWAQRARPRTIGLQFELHY